MAARCIEQSLSFKRERKGFLTKLLVLLHGLLLTDLEPFGLGGGEVFVVVGHFVMEAGQTGESGGKQSGIGMGGSDWEGKRSRENTRRRKKKGGKTRCSHPTLSPDSSGVGKAVGGEAIRIRAALHLDIPRTGTWWIYLRDYLLFGSDGL